MNNEQLHEESLKISTLKKNIYNEWAYSYDNYVKSKKYTGPIELVDILLNIISKNNINYPLKILDFGCGTGLVGKEIKKHINDVSIYGIDISEEMLKKCSSKHCYYKLFNIDISNEHIPNNPSFNFIVSSGVFLEGHANISIIPIITTYLILGGYFIFTIRNSYLENNYEQFKTYVLDNKTYSVVDCININYLENVNCKLYIITKNI